MKIAGIGLAVVDFLGLSRYLETFFARLQIAGPQFLRGAATALDDPEHPDHDITRWVTYRWLGAILFLVLTNLLIPDAVFTRSGEFNGYAVKYVVSFASLIPVSGIWQEVAAAIMGFVFFLCVFGMTVGVGHIAVHVSAFAAEKLFALMGSTPKGVFGCVGLFVALAPEILEYFRPETK